MQLWRLRSRSHGYGGYQVHTFQHHNTMGTELAHPTTGNELTCWRASDTKPNVKIERIDAHVCVVDS